MTTSLICCVKLFHSKKTMQITRAMHPLCLVSLEYLFGKSSPATEIRITLSRRKISVSFSPLAKGDLKLSQRWKTNLFCFRMGKNVIESREQLVNSRNNIPFLNIFGNIKFQLQNLNRPNCSSLHKFPFSMVMNDVGRKKQHF